MLKYFVQHAGHLGITKIIKLTYLADLEARRCLGRPITHFEYVFDKHGPFDRRLYSCIRELVDAGLVTQQDVRHFAIVEHRILDTGQPVQLSFSPAEEEVLRYLLEQYSSAPLGDLLSEVVYESRPMQRVKVRGERLPMDDENDRTRRQTGLDLAELLLAEQEATRGEFKELDEYFGELRASIAREGSGADSDLP